MRFEIKSGGMAAILISIAALSGAVFMLGLLAGYDVGRESQSSAAQVATAYPVTAPPEPVSAPDTAAGGSVAGAAPSPSVAITSPSPAAPVAASPAPPATRVATAKPVAAKPPKPVARATGLAAAPRSDRFPTEAPPPAGEVSAPSGRADFPGDEAGGRSPSTAASATAPPVVHAAAGAAALPAGASAPPGAHARHKPFNIQIEAAMDRNGANEMVHRLQGLGYQPHLVPAQLNGQTWYKVVIGPYPTQEAAGAAQQEMRTKYNSLYGGAATGADPPKPGANPGD
jgi:DedD protein